MTRHLVILGTSVTLPDPGSASDLAARFQDQSGQLADTEATLQALTRPDAWGGWTGLAADAFGQSIGQLPAELGDVRDAYEDVVTALRQYAGQLEPVVSSLSSLSYQAEDAEYTLAAVRRARSQAIASGHNPVTTGWDARLADATAAVSALRGRLNRLLGELDALSSTCTRQINAAEPRTARKSLFGELERGFVRDVADPLGHGAAEVGRDALGAGKATVHLLDDTFVQPFTELPGDLVNFAENTDLHTAGELLQHFGDAVGVVALVLTVAAVVVIASVGTGGLADVALAGAFTAVDAADGLGVVAMASHIDALGANTGAVVSHEDGASWSDVSNSALSVASDVAGSEIEDHSPIGASIVFDASSSLETTAFDAGIRYDLSIPQPAAGAPGVVSGLNVTAGAVQGLQGLPVSAGQAAGGAGVLQPAVSVSSPAVVNIQHVALAPLQGAPDSGPSGLEGNM
jgi:uncharacterized protein YukE